jgi:hypothetical protein
MQLRNAILIALAFDATPQEVEAAHDALDRQFGGGGDAVKPELLVNATVAGDTGQITTTGTGTPISNAPASTSNAQLDKNGLPWDERIHSSSKAITEKGEWRAKRNVPADLRAKVEAELKGATAANNAGPVTAAAAPAATALPLPAAPNLPPVPGAALPDPAYTELVQLIAQNTGSPTNPTGRITDEWVKQILTHYQVPDGNLQNAAHMPAVVPQITAYIRQALGQ